MICGGMRWISLVGGGILMAASAMSLAQTPDLQLGVVYQCPNAVSFKVYSCAGPANTDMCDVEAAVGTQPAQRGQSTRQQVMMLVPLCHLQSGAEAKPAPPVAGAPSNAQPDANGFKIGDTVTVATAGGWYSAVILKAEGDSYLVRMGPSLDVVKTYPDELRRVGPLNDADRARGLFALHEKVQVNVGGKWLDGEIVLEHGREYQARLADGRTTDWTTAQNLRRVAVPAKPAPPAPGTPPKPGLKSCAGKFEGRYAPSTGGAGGIQIIFRSGKATLKGFGEDETAECWMDSEKIYLHKPGESSDQDIAIDINNDGTLETPMGELKKKGN